VHIASDHTDPSIARVGNTVTLSFSSSEPLSAPPTVTIDGNPADAVNDLGANNYTAFRLMQAGDTEGMVSFSIDFNDTMGNPGVQVTDTTDSSTVILDLSDPSVTGVDATSPDGSYYGGDSIEITVSFTEPVTVNTAGGTPRLLLETGSTDRYASYSSGSGTSTLRFTYTVQKRDSSGDLDYASTNALKLNGGSIRDLASNSADLTLPAPGTPGSLGSNRDLVVVGLSGEQGNVIIRNNILNPHRGETTILNFRLSSRENVNITVYDLAGDPVKVLFSRTANQGMNEVVWDGKSKRGRPVVQGVYYIVVKIGNQRHVRKVLVVK
jgi:flagellar hook assembly protein FlgD